MATLASRRLWTFRQDFFLPILFHRSVYGSNLSQNACANMYGLSSRKIQHKQLHSTVRQSTECFGGERVLDLPSFGFAHPERAEASPDTGSIGEELSWEDILPVSSSCRNFSEIRQSNADDDAVDLEKNSDEQLIADRIAASSTTDKLSSYFSTMGIRRPREECSPHVFGLEFSSFVRKVRLLCAAGLTEQEACQLAVLFPVVQLPEECMDCLRVLRKHNISVTEMAKNDPQNTPAILSMRPSKLETNVNALKRAGLRANNIERLKSFLLLNPLEDVVIERMKLLDSTSNNGEHVESLLNLASSSKAAMCSAEEAPALMELIHLVRELNLSSSLVDIASLRACDTGKLRLNLMELTGSPLFMLPKVVNSLLHREQSRNILINSEPEDLRRHIQSLVALSDEQPMANVIQSKLREQPSLLNPALSIQGHSKLLKCLFPISSEKMALFFRQHAYFFTLTEEEIQERIRICKGVPGLTTERMLQINVFKRSLLRLQSAVETAQDMPGESVVDNLQKFLSGNAMPVFR